MFGIAAQMNSNISDIYVAANPPDSIPTAALPNNYTALCNYWQLQHSFNTFSSLELRLYSSGLMLRIVTKSNYNRNYFAI